MDSTRQKNVSILGTPDMSKLNKVRSDYIDQINCKEQELSKVRNMLDLSHNENKSLKLINDSLLSENLKLKKQLNETFK